MPSLRQISIPTRIRMSWLLIASATTISTAQSAFTVGASGTHTSIQSAVDACPNTGCTIQLIDSVYALPRELWIEGKQNLSIEGSATLRHAGIRPRLHSDTKYLMLLAGTASNPTDPLRPAGWKRWPNTCKDTLGGSLDKTNPYSTNGYQYNGLVVIVASRNIRLEGLTFDGLIPTYFGNQAIWDCKYDVLFGNIGVNLFHSKSVVLRDNEMRNFFSSIYIQNRNPGGAAASWNSSDVTGPVVAPYSASGTMGDHLVERNDIHHNWWAVYDELEWDLGSTFRYNRVASNVNTKYGNIPEFLSEAENMPGGFMFVKDVSQVIHRIHNNTIWGSPVVIGHNGYKYGAQHLFYNNIVGGFEQVIKDRKLMNMLGDYRQLLSYYTDWLDNNTFEVRDSSATFGKNTIRNAYIPDTNICTSQGLLPPCYIKIDTAVTYQYIIAWPWRSWKVASYGIVRVKVGGVTFDIKEGMATEQFPGGGVISTLLPGSKNLDITSSANYWASAIPWKSTTPGTEGFLEPDWTDSIVIRTILGKGRKASGFPTTFGAPDRGAVLSSHTYPVIWSLRSQEPVLKAGTNCYSIPLRIASGAAEGPTRISKVEAWSFAYMTALMSSPGSSKRIPVRTLADSSFSDGVTRVVCLDSTPSPTAALRIQVELTSTTPSGQVTSEPAYFQLDSPSADYSVKTSLTSPLPNNLRVRWDNARLVIWGIADGPTRVTVRTLEGRTLLTTTAHATNGTLSVPQRSTPSGTTIVTVEQEGRKKSLLAARLDAMGL